MLGNLINSFLPRAPRAATVQTLGHPAAGVIGWWNPEQNVSGQHVTEASALNISAVWCGVRIISETLASLPCILYRRNGSNDKSRASDDPRYSLVHDYPCEEVDAYHFFEASTAHQVLWGNSYGKVVRNGFNDPVEIEIRLPDRTEPKRRREDGTLVYECNDPKETIEFTDMLHVAGFGFDGIKGYSLIEKAAQSLGIAMAADKHAGSSLKHGNVPSGVLEVPTRMEKGPRDLLRKEWDEIHTTAGRLAITHGGMKYTPIGMDHEKSQLLQSRKFNIPEIARWLRLPPHMLADLENSAVRANIEQQAMEFIQYSLTPWVKRWEGALRMKLLRREERRSMYFEFLLDSLLRGDTLTRYQAHALARQWGFKSVNEIRSTENDNSIGPNGDVYMQPMNMAPVGEPRQDVPETIRSEYQKALKDALSETIDVAKQMKGALERGFCSVNEAFAEFGAQHHQAISSERETFRLIKDDIANLGQAVQVSIPQAIEEICQGQQVLCELFDHSAGSVEMVLPPAADNRIEAAVKEMLTEGLRSLLRIEASEAVKAAAGQARGQNFLKRIQEFYVKHHEKVKERLSAAIKVAGTGDASELADRHCDRSRDDLLDCSDGDPAGFEARVKACVEKWATERLEHEAREFHEKLF